MDKYLSLYAEPEVQALKDLLKLFEPPEPWSHVIAIPACNEKPDLLRPPPKCDGRSLMILVINESAGASKQVSDSNLILANAVREQFEQQLPSDQTDTDNGLTLFSDPSNNRNILMVDRFIQGRQLPDGGGVGLARKIGADLATLLISEKHIKSNWIHCTDGDVELPDTYLTCIESADLRDNRTTAALIYPFTHIGKDKNIKSPDLIVQATQLYELSLRYYVAGMRYAGSPYAFHTIGSTMAASITCDASSEK